MNQKQKTLTKMYALFSHDKQTGVPKNKFWECAERLGATLTKAEVDGCFKLFDRTDKGYFTFNDFTRVSKIVQGFEIDLLFKEGDKVKRKIGGKKCIGFAERMSTDYNTQKSYRDKKAASHTR